MAEHRPKASAPLRLCGVLKNSLRLRSYSADITAMIALPMIFASAATTGSRSPRSITAAAVTGSLISSHNDNAAIGASVNDVKLTALKTRGQKRLFGACLGRSVAGLGLAMVLF